MKDKVKQEVLKLIKDHDMKCSIEDFAAKAYWDLISTRQDLSEDFIEEFQHDVDWQYISYYSKLSDDFIRRFKHRLFWNYACKAQSLSEDIILEFLNDGTIYFLYTISRHQKLSIEFVRKNFNLLSASGLLENKNFNLLQKAEILFKRLCEEIKTMFGISKVDFDIKGDFHFRFIVSTVLFLFVYFSMFVLVNKPLLYFLLSFILFVGFEIKIQMENKVKTFFGLVSRQLKAVFKAFNMFFIQPKSSPEKMDDDLNFESSYEVKYYAPKGEVKSRKGKATKAKSDAKPKEASSKLGKKSPKPKNPSKPKKSSKEVPNS